MSVSNSSSDIFAGWGLMMPLTMMCSAGADMAGMYQNLLNDSCSLSNSGNCEHLISCQLSNVNDITDGSNSAICWSYCCFTLSKDSGAISWERAPTITIKVVVIDYWNDWENLTQGGQQLQKPGKVRGCCWRSGKMCVSNLQIIIGVGEIRHVHHI